MKRSQAELLVGILLALIALGLLFIFLKQDNIEERQSYINDKIEQHYISGAIEQTYISNQIDQISRGNKEIIERLNQPLDLYVR